MLITSAPIVIPVNTANVPTEAVAAEATQRPKIPQPPSASEGSRSKNSTEFNEQPKSSPLLDGNKDQNQSIEEKDSSEQQQNGQSSSQPNSEEQLETEELAQIQKLRKRDREVRSHEQAHAAAGGILAGPPNLNYTTGPDGKRYAVSGDVSIDISKVANDPEATIRKLEQVQRAALAPVNPSAQDVKVAAIAAALVNQARTELNLERLQEVQEQKEARSEEVGDEVSADDNLKESNASSVDFLSPDENQFGLNPVQARRQATQLNQRIAGSGALDVNESSSRSFRV